MAGAGDKYDVVVIGAGTAGMTAARLTAEMGHRVAMIEEERVGGECLYTGCVPSKALIESAKVFYQMRHAADYGLRAPAVDFDFAQVMERVQRIVRTVEPHDSVERYAGLGVECLQFVLEPVFPY